MKNKSIIFKILAGLFCLPSVFFSPISAQTVIGGSTPDPSAMLDVQSNSKGVLFPRITTTQRNAISSPATGLIIMNTTNNCLEINLGSSGNPSWQQIICTPGLVGSLLLQQVTVNPPLFPNTSASGVNVNLQYSGAYGNGYEGQSFELRK